MANKDFQMRNLIEQGKQITPGRVKVTFRYKTGTTGATIIVYGIGRDTTVPTPLTTTGSAISLTGESGPKETSQIIELINDFNVTDVVVRINNIETLAKVHNIVMLGRPTEITPEEYRLV